MALIHRGYVDNVIHRKRVVIDHEMKITRPHMSEEECKGVEMSPAQKEVFFAIDEWWKKYGFSPTIRDIAYLTGRTGLGNVHKIVNRLIKLGVIKKVERSGRSIRPVYINFRNLE